MSYGEDQTDARRGGRLITFVVALVAVLMLAGGIWFAYDRGLQRGAGGPPLIKADGAPTKVAPANPGGLQVPNQNIEVYSTVQRGGQGQKGGVEKLLPPPEQPLPEASRPAAAPPPAAGSSQVVSIPPAPPPQVVKTPDAAPAPQQQAAVKPPAPATAPAPAPAAVKPPPAAAPPPAMAPVAAPSGAGGIRVQLAAHREQALATAEWGKLQKKFPDILGALSPTYERADLGDRGVFIRVQAGPFHDRAAAQAACDRLKAANQGCSIVGR